MPEDCNDRTRIALREYVDQRLIDLEKRLDQQRDDLKDRLAGMNEFREALKDQANMMATREQLENLRVWAQDQFEQLRDRITETRLHVASISAGVAILVTIIGIVISRFMS